MMRQFFLELVDNLQITPHHVSDAKPNQSKQFLSLPVSLEKDREIEAIGERENPENEKASERTENCRFL